MFLTLLSLKYVLSVYVNDHVDIFLNKLDKFYLNDMLNLHPLTPHIVPSYTHKFSTKWRTYRGHRFWDVNSPYVFGHVARLDDDTPAHGSPAPHQRITQPTSWPHVASPIWSSTDSHGASGSTSYETIPPVQLESSGGVLSTVDMVVQRRNGPRRLRDHDDDVNVNRPSAVPHHHALLI